jgi:hypothetical protein
MYLWILPRPPRNQSIINLARISWHLGPIPTAYFINTLTVARQRLGKNFTAATNKHETEKFLDASFSMRSVSCKIKVDDQLFADFRIAFAVYLTMMLEKLHSIEKCNMNPIFLDLSTGWRWVISFMLRLLYPRGKSPQYPFDGRSERRGEERVFALTGTRNSDHSVAHPVAGRYTDWATPAPSLCR